MLLKLELNLRKVKVTDYPKLAQILHEEGIPLDKMAFDRDETWVEENNGEIDGFFTFQEWIGIPYVIHFYTEKTKRNHRLFLKMVIKLKSLLRGKNKKIVILNVPETKEYVKKFVEAYTHRKPYMA